MLDAGFLMLDIQESTMVISNSIQYPGTSIKNQSISAMLFTARVEISYNIFAPVGLFNEQRHSILEKYRD
jgi:hypothetical protein